MVHIAIFASGNGSNAQNIIRRFKGSDVVSVDLVLSNKADAYVLKRAGDLGVPTAFVPKADFAREDILLPLLESHGIGFIVLAGFLLMVPDFLLERYGGRIINIHPSLLPKFGGRGMWGHHVHEAVKAAGESETGMTVHYVSSVCDGGEVIAQFSVPVLPTDSAEDIAAKEHVLEMELFPDVILEVLKEKFPSEFKKNENMSTNPPTTTDKSPFPPFRVGNGFDVHATAQGLPMWLGGVRIEDSPVGFVAHSDGDVAIHALCDAILGALALGDIGHHFPDTSPRWKGIDSKVLLSKVMQLAGERGWEVVNADITIALQAPKVGKYVPLMRETLASVMGTSVQNVSVKATTTERLGFVGREEGCEVWATVLLYHPDAT